MKPETRFRRNKVLPFLKTLPKTAYFPVDQSTINGDPDYFLCVRGNFVALEVKDDGQVPRPLQQIKLDWVWASEGISLVATPSNWDEIKDKLSKLARGEPI